MAKLLNCPAGAPGAKCDAWDCFRTRVCQKSNTPVLEEPRRAMVTPDTEAIRQNLIIALAVAIQEQERYERNDLRYTRDSAMLATWRLIKTELEETGR